MADKSSWNDIVEEEEKSKEELVPKIKSCTENNSATHSDEATSLPPVATTHTSTHSSDESTIGTLVKTTTQPSLMSLVSVNHVRPISSESLYASKRQSAIAGLAKTYAYGARNGTIIGVFYSLPSLPIIYQFDLKSRLLAVNNAEALKNLISKNDLSIRQLCQSVRHFAQRCVNTQHKCLKQDSVLSGSSLECVECVRIIVSNMRLNVMDQTIQVFDSTNADRILYGFMLYAKSWLVTPVNITDPNAIIYAPTTIIPKMLANTVGSTFDVDVDTVGNIQFKSFDTSEFMIFAVTLCLEHFAFTQRILEVRIKSINFSKDGVNFAVPFPCVSRFDGVNEVVDARATLTPSMLSTLSARGMRLSNIPTLRMLYSVKGENKIELTPYGLVEMIRTNLVYIYTRACREPAYADSLGSDFATKVSKNPTIIEFLKTGTFKVLGHGSGIVPAKIEVDASQSRIVETFWNFQGEDNKKYDMNSLLAIFNPRIFVKLTTLMYQDLQATISGTPQVGITWVVEYFKSCYVIIIPPVTIDGTMSRVMSKNDFGRKFATLDKLSWDDDTSTINRNPDVDDAAYTLFEDKTDYIGVNSLNMLDYNVALARARLDLTQRSRGNPDAVRKGKSQLKGDSYSAPSTPVRGRPKHTPSATSKPSPVKVKENLVPEKTAANYPLLSAAQGRFPRST